MRSTEANVIRERDEAFSMQGGPYGFERVGVAFNIRSGYRVFWVGCYSYPSKDPDGKAAERFRDDEHFAKCLADAWNRRNNTGVEIPEEGP